VFDLRMGTARIGIAMPGVAGPFVIPLIESRIVGTITETSWSWRRSTATTMAR
jgi:hypothetical protein